MRVNEKIARLNIKNLSVLNREKDWVTVTINQQEIDEGIYLGTLQEEESKKRGLKDRSFTGDDRDSLTRSIAAKQFEFAIRRYGGGTARVVQVNEFHDHPDVGEVNARFTFNPGYGLIITNRDQGLVPMILGTGKCPEFKLMGWIIPDFARQFIYKVHQNRNEETESNFGFLHSMKDHELFQINSQMLLPMSSFNKELIK